MTPRSEALRRLTINHNWPINEDDLIYGHRIGFSGWRWVQTTDNGMVLRSEWDDADITRSEWGQAVRAASNGHYYPSTIPRHEVIKPMSRGLKKWPFDLDEARNSNYGMHGWGWILIGDNVVFRSRGDVPDITKSEWLSAKRSLVLVATAHGHFYR